MHIPLATYRIQFNPSFGFKHAAKIVSYLSDLGISDIYASPIFKARKGSQHGYDIVDPNQLNPELGSMEDFEDLNDNVKKQGLYWLQDIVPHHMAIASDNLMLMNVLENGSRSAYFDFFDIRWRYSDNKIVTRLLIPLLGRFYGECLEDAEIQLSYDEGGFNINYYDLKLPIRLESYIEILESNIENLEERLIRQSADFTNYLGNVNFIKSLLSDEEGRDRSQEVHHGKRMLWDLYNSSEGVRQFINENIALFNGTKGVSHSFDRLDRLISDQLFRLSFWKVATEELNYRRFFTINELISLRQEDESVFDRTHELVFDLINKGKIDGIRVDHIDGLYDPTGYLNRLREKAPENYVIAEKILEFREQLPTFWPIQGTTGYDFLNYVNKILCYKDNEAALDKIYEKFTGQRSSYEDLLSQKKRQVIGNYMAGDIDNLAQSLKNISALDRHGSDITLYGLRRALVEVIAFFPVYRTYISDGFSREIDNIYIQDAIDKARDRNPGLLYELNFIEKFLLLREEDSICAEDRESCMKFIMNFQQYTGPLMAKGFEDTVLYIYNRLISLNEVGGSPKEFGISIDEFHDFNSKRLEIIPNSLNTTSTHDTKRGEDVRARINVLSEIPDEWEKNLRNWSKINHSKRSMFKNRTIPDGNDEYFLYQTLLGSYPFSEEKDYPDRIKNYIIKAVREAKVHTAWIKPDIEYENAFLSFIENILARSKKNKFLESFLPFQKKIAFYGALNSLSQTLLKITSPGVPDIYQGSELWDLSLVDPDNRRPVDFEIRQSYINDFKEKIKKDIIGLISELLSNIEDGRVKMFLVHQALQVRKNNIEVFREGTYEALATGGQFKDHVIAFARKLNSKLFITVAPRYITKISPHSVYPLGRKAWQDTYVKVPEESFKWINVITNRNLELQRSMFIGEVLAEFPVALLEGEKKIREGIL